MIGTRDVAMKRFAVLLVVMALAFSSPAQGQDGRIPGGKVPVDVPRIMQIKALPDGSLLALSPEKGGLYQSLPGGRGWHKAPNVPEVFIHHLNLDPAGRIYLATSQGLLRSLDDRWESLLEGTFAAVYFDAAGRQVLVKAWGKGVYCLRPEALTAERVRRLGELAARKQALEGEAGALMAQMRDQRGVTGEDGTRGVGRLYRRWQEIQGAVQGLEKELKGLSLAGKGALADRLVTCAAMDRQGRWLAGTFGFGVYGAKPGEEWRSSSAGLGSSWIVTMAAAPWGTVYAGTYGAGLWAWDEVLSAWSAVDGGPADAVVEEIAFGRGGECVVATQTQGVFVSTDRGKTWNRSVVMPKTAVQSVAVDGNGKICAGLWEGGLHVLQEDGVTWRHRPFADVTRVTDLAFGADGAGYAALAGLGLLRSDDNGRRWNFVATPVRPGKDLRVIVDSKGNVLVGSRADGLWRSEDRGRTWVQDMRGLPEGGINHLSVTPEGILLAVPADASGLFARSESGDWRLLPIVGEDNWAYSVWEVRFLPDGRCVAFGYQDLLVSTDCGQTWRRERFGQGFRSLAFDSRGAIFTQRMLSTFVLRPDEEEWASVQDMPDTAAFSHFVAAGERRWLGAKSVGGIALLSMKDGILVPLRHGLEEDKVVSMAVSADGSLFAGLEEGLRVSRDEGRTWQAVTITEELPRNAVPTGWKDGWGFRQEMVTED